MPKKQEKLTSIRLTSELKGLLDQHCQELDLTASEIIRKSLAHYLAHLQTGQVREKFLDQCEKKGFEFASIISEAIKSYLEESEAVRLELREPTTVEKVIRKHCREG